MTFGDWLVVVATVGVGVVAGILSALLGIGGAVISTPAVRLFGATPIQAVGSTVPAILPGAISGSLRYAREGLVDFRVALYTGVAGSLFALLGAWGSDHVDGGILMVLTAALMLWSGISVVRGGADEARSSTLARAAEGPATPGPSLSPAPGGQDLSGSNDSPRSEDAVGSEVADAWQATGIPDDAGRRTNPLLLGAVGAASGFVAGLLGVGGGIVLVPALTGPLGLPMKRAVASSLVAVAIYSVPALITHLLLGHINWRYALPLMIGVVPGARLGARLTVRHSDRTVRRLFGLLVVVLAVVYGSSELAALL